ncbi:MAG: hypothetical protein KAH18_11510 [Psychromonas sp.]|nr:hypothetical protein [Psychromonas sp.]
MKTKSRLLKLFKKKSILADKETEDYEQSLTNAITILFIDGERHTFTEIDKVLINESIISIISNSTRAISAGKRALEEPRSSAALDYIDKVITCFGMGDAKHLYVHKKILKIYNLLKDPDKIIKFIDVRCNNDSEELPKTLIDRTELPSYESSVEQTQYQFPSLVTPTSSREPLKTPDRPLADILDGAASPIDIIEGACAPPEYSMLNNSGSSTASIEDTSTFRNYMGNVHLGLHINVMEDMLCRNRTNEERTRVICHDIICQVLNITYHSEQGELFHPLLCEYHATEYPDRTLTTAVCWSFFIECFDKKIAAADAYDHNSFAYEIEDENARFADEILSSGTDDDQESYDEGGDHEIDYHDIMTNDELSDN